MYNICHLKFCNLLLLVYGWGWWTATVFYDFSLTDIERSENSKAQRHLNIQQNWESKYWFEEKKQLHLISLYYNQGIVAAHMFCVKGLQLLYVIDPVLHKLLIVEIGLQRKDKVDNEDGQHKRWQNFCFWNEDWFWIRSYQFFSSQGFNI